MDYPALADGPREPYASGLAVGRPRGQKSLVSARFVSVIDTRRTGRGLVLIAPYTRAVRQGDVHEIICTDEDGVAPQGVVNDVATWGFVEFSSGGVLMAGDRVQAQGCQCAVIVGFDETHMPNHMNIVVHAMPRRSGVEMGFKLGEELVFKG